MFDKVICKILPFVLVAILSTFVLPLVPFFSETRIMWLEIIKIVHYANTPMQYTAIFHGCKNINFQIKNSNIFLIFAKNIDCWYSLEPPQ